MAVYRNFEETLEFLFSQLPMYQRVGSVAFKKNLTNIKLLCKALQHPQKKFKTIHIAGTNGKGTVSHLIAFGLQQQGLKVGLYTSPHYKDFRERIKINGELMDKKSVTAFVNRHQDLILSIQPSFFEITVAMALDYFAQQNVDVAVIEVGLGGRLDSTNVINPILSVITNISYDHMDMLGNTLPKIAGEKAGIIKKHTPVLIGEYQQETIGVFEKVADKKEAPFFLGQQLVKLDVHKKNAFIHHLILDIKGGPYKFKTGLTAPYHEKNFITAFSALFLLEKEFNIDWNKISKHFFEFPKVMKYWGRWQIIQTQPLIILDSAHNEAGIQLAMQELNRFQFNNVHFVVGFVKDKDLQNILTLFPHSAQYYFCKAKIPRGLDAPQLKELGKNYGLNGKAYTCVKKAYNAAVKRCGPKGVVYVGGSIFVTAEIV